MSKKLIIKRNCIVSSAKNGAGYETGLIKLNDKRLLAVKGFTAKVKAIIELEKERK
jgi:hypothetical protein